MTLNEIIRNEFHNGEKFWNYYDFQANFPLSSDESYREFISEYFIQGSKMSVVMDWKTNDTKNIVFRNAHTVNVFFIGSYLQQSFDPSLSIELNRNTSLYINYRFSYFWYLTALAHDFGYLFEQLQIDSLSMDELKNKYSTKKDRFTGNTGDRKILYKHMGWDINYRVPCFPLRKEICYNVERNRYSNTLPCQNSTYEEACKGCLTFSNGTTIKNSWYSFGLKERYFRYRLLEWNVFDHGIVGGDKFYSNMIANYRQKFLEEATGQQFMWFSDKNYRCFACEQFKLFAYIADCIECHNIFMSSYNESSRTTYQKYQLEELLPENYEKISYQTNPLLFMLCLADTLEPCKRFSDMPPEKVLDALELSLKDNRIKVIIHKDMLDNDIRIEKYAQDLNLLHTWMNTDLKAEIV